MSFMRSLAMKKKIALLMTFAVCVIGAAAWFIIYNAERRSAVDGARDTLGRYLTVAVSSAEREGLAGLVHAEKVWQEMYPHDTVHLLFRIFPDICLQRTKEFQR